MICRTPNRRIAPARRAFTLIELMVVTVIVLILMSILVAASSIATGTVRDAKAQGDFVAQERMALAVLRRDLQYDHFLEEDGKPNLGRKVSDQNTQNLKWYSYSDTSTTPATTRYATRGYKPPRSGYFAASSLPATQTNILAYDSTKSTTWNFAEGSDNDGFASSRSGNHYLQFTIIVPGGAPQDILTADVPLGSLGNPIAGRAGEVAYFLVPNGMTSQGGAAKYKLIRRQRLAAMTDDDRPAYRNVLNSTGALAADPPEVMAAYVTVAGPPAKFEMLHLNDLTLAANRLGTPRAPRAAITQYRIGEDVLLTNVTSFEVKFTGPRASPVTWPADPSLPTSTEWPRPYSVNNVVLNTDYPYDNLPYDGGFDTFNSTQGDWTDAKYLAGSPTAQANPPLKPLRITGVSIRLRCWNGNTKGSRQTTLRVDL